jgi:hypothetical protein
MVNSTCGDLLMNGWSNTDTWAAFTEISNSESQYEAARDICKKNIPISMLVYSMRLRFGDRPGVNWREITEAFVEGL